MRFLIFRKEYAERQNEFEKYRLKDFYLFDYTNPALSHVGKKPHTTCEAFFYFFFSSSLVPQFGQFKHPAQL